MNSAASDSPNQLAAVVLCGGQSRRMGQPKATLPFGAATLLEHVVARLTAFAQPIVVVAAHAQANSESLPSLPGVTLVRDRQPDRGPLEGLAVALATLGDQANPAFVTSCDAPLVCEAFVRYLANSLGDHDAVVPQDADHRYPLAGVYRTRVLADVESMLTSGELRLLDLLDRINVRFISTAELRAVDPELDSLHNVNDPDAYRVALKRCGK